ncbi:MAG: hypothetical protein M1823_005629 [Watsoniomyces obsoletus]|nr:MAG: hypothetical protein M1823_005629 [Watsoniomyces obsoletus]
MSVNWDPGSEYTVPNNASGDSQQQPAGAAYHAHITEVAPHAGSTYDQWLQPNVVEASMRFGEAFGLLDGDPSPSMQTSGKRKAPATSGYPGPESMRQKAPRLLQPQLSTHLNIDGDHNVEATPGPMTMTQLPLLEDRGPASTGGQAETAQTLNQQELLSSILPPFLPVAGEKQLDQPRPAPDGHEGDIPRTLPPTRVFPIQIGTELFKLSGASISSDAPSYFSEFFVNQRVTNCDELRTLYFDRDPITFRDIARHLQGYYIQPRDGSHFVKLLADAQFYSLPRLTSQLMESDIFIKIGGRDFQIPRDIFSSPGNSPNYFTLGFASFFTSPTKVFPGVKQEVLLRPPAVSPPSVPNRSAEIFADLIHMLRGYPLRIRDDEHRQALVRDCRYYRFQGLEQQLIPHDIRYNRVRETTELLLRLEDVRISGLSVATAEKDKSTVIGYVHYQRPFVDQTPEELLLEIGHSCTTVEFGQMTAFFEPKSVQEKTRFLHAVWTKAVAWLESEIGPTDQDISGIGPGPPDGTKRSGKKAPLKVYFHPDAHVTLNGRTFMEHQDTHCECCPEGNPVDGSSATGDGIERLGDICSPAWTFPQPDEWYIANGQWRIRLEAKIWLSKWILQIILVAVKLDAHTDDATHNARRTFLTP